MNHPSSDFDRSIQHARRLFREGREIPSPIVADAVQRSWLRSRDYGLDEDARIVFEPLSRTPLRNLEEEHRLLACHAEPEMRRLFAALGGADWIVACLEAQGHVIRALGGDRPELRGIATALRPGVNLNERVVGTNGPGCALAEQRVSVICGAEHFLEEIRKFSCVAVPIFHPDGRLAGALNASRNHDGRPLGIVEPLALAARAIENSMLAGIPSAHVLHLHYSAEMVLSGLAGLLAISAEGRLLGATPTARQLLGLEAASGQAVETLFAEPLGRLLDRLRHADGRPEAVRCSNGIVLYARLEEPGGAVRSHAARTADAKAPATLRAMCIDAGSEPAIRQAERAFAWDLPILVNGETGTGKEMLARHLHDSGPRKRGPFVAINCSAIPAGLIESELFGYEGGAFTGARRTGMAGRIEQADGGTLFLDEIGDMPKELQARLLRVLQERSLTRLGGSRVQRVDCSLICATHRDLRTLVERGEFREDLYYRINGLRVELPPLRKRDDFDALVGHLMRAEAGGRPLPALSPGAAEMLRRHHWPGNIRELQQVLRLGMALAEHGRIAPEHLPRDLLRPAPAERDDGVAPQTTLEHAELEAIRGALERNRRNLSATARELGIARATLYRKLRHFGLMTGDEHERTRR